MKTLSYDRDTTTLFEFLKDNTPKRIYTDDNCQTIFDYGDFHVAAIPESLTAASQNGSDEMIHAEFERIESAFEPSKIDNLTFQDKVIDRLWILQTLLYFTNYIAFNSEAEALGDFEVKTKADKIIADLMKKSGGSREQIVCHPDSAEAQSVDLRFANLIEAGIMLEIDSQLLMCFSFCNSFGVVGDTMSTDEIKEEVTPFYKLIEI